MIRAAAAERSREWRGKLAQLCAHISHQHSICIDLASSDFRCLTYLPQHVRGLVFVDHRTISVLTLLSGCTGIKVVLSDWPSKFSLWVQVLGMSQSQIQADLKRLRAVAAVLSPVLGDRWIEGDAQRSAYANSEGHHALDIPAAVVQPINVDEVQLVVTAASEARIPLVPCGARTSLEGNCAADSGAIAIDLTRMRRVITIAADDLLCIVEPGVTRESLNTELRATGLFFPVDPGANATVGGMISTRASGTTAVRYGTMRENILALTVVLSDGRILRTGTRARKSAAGYDLTHLFTGAEGTLGIIVEATLRLHGVPEVVTSGVWPFPTIDGAVQTVIAAMQTGIPVARLELLDEVAAAASNRYSQLSLPETPLLFVELHGTRAMVEEHRSNLEELGRANGGQALVLSSDADQQRALWRARHCALPAAKSLLASSVVWTTDICVPISHLGEAISRTRSMIDRAELTAPIVGHVGDGNFHVLFVLHPDNKESWSRARAVNEEMIAFALSVGGTCTGEHGIGIGKREALLLEHGNTALSVMKQIKAALDPHGIMNPGKIFI